MKMMTFAKSILGAVAVGAVCSLAPTASALTTVDTENILFLKQEEKLARDVYEALYAQWGHQTFLNISASEQQHMDAVDGLIERYGLVDTASLERGEFTIPELQNLYHELITLGSQSLEAALSVGVSIEVLDIQDIQEMLDTTEERPIQRVLTNLQDGSYNHLDAFNTALDQLTASGSNGGGSKKGASRR